MRKVCSIVVMVLLVFSVAGMANAAEKTRVKQVSGEVIAVDAMANSLTVKGRTAEVVLSTDAKTTVRVDKEVKSLADVQIGDRVTVKYAETEGKTIVRSIIVKPKAELKPEVKGPVSSTR